MKQLFLNYVIIFIVDPDAPNRKRPIDRSWHHWLVGNIPGQNIKEGETISEYIGAAPAQTTGKLISIFYKNVVIMIQL